MLYSTCHPVSHRVTCSDYIAVSQCTISRSTETKASLCNKGSILYDARVGRGEPLPKTVYPLSNYHVSERRTVGNRHLTRLLTTNNLLSYIEVTIALNGQCFRHLWNWHMQRKHARMKCMLIPWPTFVRLPLHEPVTSRLTFARGGGFIFAKKLHDDVHVERLPPESSVSISAGGFFVSQMCFIVQVKVGSMCRS